jgi:serine/threonine-protein kinase RsbW
MKSDIPQWLWERQVTIPSKMDAAHQLISELMEGVRAARWDKKDLFAVELSIEEAFANAIEHGNKSDVAKQVHFLGKVSSRMVYVRIEDEGQGFDPEYIANPTEIANLSMPSGRGVHLIRGFATRAEWNDKGNVVEIEIDRTA